MCDDNCENLKKDRIRCEPCRTINLAMHARSHKPDMQVYQKCRHPAIPTCDRITELPIKPTCIKVCTRDEYKLRKSGKKILPPKPPIGHGKLMYGVKAGLIAGAVYFTYSQGIWGDQQDSTECLKRWQEYVRSFHTRRPPTFDNCGNVIHKPSTDSIVAPMYSIYKGFITTCFSGVVKLPLVLKCMYLDYLKALEKKEQELAKARKLKGG